MASVLTTASTVKCAHGGTVTLKASQSQLLVAGNPALTALDLVGAPIQSCPVVSSPSSAPCVTVATVIVGPATTLLVNGQPVLLDTATGLTNGVPSPATWSVSSAGHTTFAAN
jgi:hypothetical protein